MKFAISFRNVFMRRKSVDVARGRYNRAARDLKQQAANSASQSEHDALMRMHDQLRDRAKSLRGIDAKKRLDPEIKALVKDSESFLQSALNDDWMRGEALGNLRLSGTNAGHRFFAITRELWINAPKGGRLDAIRRAVARDADVRRRYGRRPNVSQLIEIIEQATGIKIDVDDQMIGDTDRELLLIWQKSVMQRHG